MNVRTTLAAGRLFLAVSIGRYDIAELLVAKGYVASAAERDGVTKLLERRGKSDIHGTLFRSEGR